MWEMKAHLKLIFTEKKDNKTMKKIIILILAAYLFNACNMIKAPEFKGIDKIDYKIKDNGKFYLIAQAKFHNPNLVGGKFKVENIQVYADDKPVGVLNSESYKVPSKKDFVIPLEIEFDKSFFSKKNNILDVLNTLINNKLKVKYKGIIRYVSHGLNVPYKIDYQQDVKIYDKK